MLPSLRCLLPLLALTVSLPGVRAEDPAVHPSAVPVVWRLADSAWLAGAKAEPLGERRPEVVGDAGGRAALRFNGTNTGLLVPTLPISGAAAFAIELLIRPQPGGPVEQRYLHFEDTAGRRGLCELRMNQPDAWSFDAFVRAGDAQAILHDPALTHPAGRWTWVAMVYDGKRLASYVDGVKEFEREVAFGPLEEGRTSLGVRQTLKSWFQGELAEVRWHRRALAADELQRAK